MSLIRFKTFHFGDWVLDSQNMTNQQKGILVTLMTLYFDNATSNNGKLEASDFEMLCWQSGCHRDDEIADLKRILKAKFKKIGNAYRRAIWDKEIKAIIWEIKKGGNTGNIQSNTQGNTQGNASNTQGNAPLTAYERKLKSEAKRQQILAKLADIDVIPSDNAKMKELETLYKAHFGRDFVGDGNTQGNTGKVDGNTQGNAGNAQKSSNNHKPITINHKPLNNLSPQTPQGEVSEHEQTPIKTTTTSQTPNTSDVKKPSQPLNISFDDFWDLYDKNQDRPKCERLWSKLSDQERLDIMAYLPKYKQSQPDKKYRKHPQTFLNNRSWENEIIDSTSKPAWQKSPSGPKFGGKDDPLAVNQRWADYQPPPNRDENFKIAMARLANPKAQPTGMIEI